MNSQKLIKFATFIILGFSIFFLLFILMGCSKDDKVKVTGTRIAVEDQLEIKKTVVKDIPPLPEPERLTVFPPENKNVQNIKLKTASFKEVYEKDIGRARDFITAGPVIRDGKIYTVDTRGYVKAFRIENGKELKEFRIKNHRSLGAGLAADKDRVIVTGGNGYVTAVDKELSKVLWRVDLNAPLRTPPAISGSRIFVYTKTGELVALSAETGKELWRRNTLFQESAPLFGANVVVEKGTIVVSSTTGEVWGFQAENGTPVFTKKITGPKVVMEADASKAILATPLFDGKILIAASPKNVFMAIRPEAKDPVWQKDVGLRVTPLKVGGILYAVTVDEILMAISAVTGEVYFETPVSLKGMTTGMMMAENKIVLTSEKGDIGIFNARTGKLEKKINLDEKIYLNPVAGDDTLFVLTDEGNLYAYR